MDRSSLGSGKRFAGQESTPARGSGILLAVLGTILIALAVLDGWPVGL